MKHVPVIALLVLTCSAAGVRAQDTPVPASSTPEPCFIGTSLFTLMNLAPDDQPPHFYQVNIGYMLTPKDRLSVEAITWRYYHPLGIPWGESRESADKAYPGHVREFGVGLEYQRLLTKGFYSSISAVPSIAFNYWPISTNVPDAFAAQDERWPSYFLAEPGLNIGFTF